MDNTSDWRDGRLVVRRPEARDSIMRKTYIPLTSEEATTLKEAVTATVVRRRSMTDTQREAELQRLAELARERGLL